MLTGLFGQPGQGLIQLGDLLLALLLSSVVGLEREMRQKSAGLRTYTLVGVSAALFTLISKHGFDNVLEAGRIVLDPSRVAAQIVSGIGFIGGGVIFMRRDMVRGLTTAASIWLTAALGMACGAGLPLLAVATTLGHFIIMFVYPKLIPLLPREKRATTRLRIAYEDDRDLLRPILVTCTELRFAIDGVSIERNGLPDMVAAMEAGDHATAAPARRATVLLTMRVKGKRPASHLIARLAGIDGVVQVGSTGDDDDLE